MGTNYYITRAADSFDEDELGTDTLHIGKSSAGWCFSLHVIPSKGINSLDDWLDTIPRLQSEGWRLRDEYGEAVTLYRLKTIIRDRSFTRPKGSAAEEEAWWRQNHAEPGPFGLARHKIDNHRCIGHGKGTWDLICGDFS